MEFTLKRSVRARAMRLTVRPGGSVVLTAPARLHRSVIEEFFQRHASWIEKAKARMRHLKALPVSGRRSYLQYKEAAREFAHERVAYWNQMYGYSYGRIAIKNTRRTWGSCSRKGNLNFSYAILFLPRELADYVTVHEICHLKEHNHSPAFWALVARALPEYREYRTRLRQYVR